MSPIRIAKLGDRSRDPREHPDFPRLSFQLQNEATETWEDRCLANEAWAEQNRVRESMGLPPKIDHSRSRNNGS